MTFSDISKHMACVIRLEEIEPASIRFWKVVLLCSAVCFANSMTVVNLCEADLVEIVAHF